MTLKCPSGTVYIPDGAFLMGGDDKPVTSVAVSSFCMDEHEVTNAEYSAYESKKDGAEFELITTACGGGTSVIARGADAKALLATNKSKLDGEKICGLEAKPVIQSDAPKSPKGFDGPNQPRVNVDWFKAKAYCEAKGGRLPTEAEWKKAARGPQGYEYGTTSGALNHAEAQYKASTTADVCTHGKNGYGLCDMTGNVWEWINDWYKTDEWFARKPDANAHTYGVQCGGSWDDTFSDSLRVDDCAGARPDYSQDDFGFRCVVVPQDSSK